MDLLRREMERKKKAMVQAKAAAAAAAIVPGDDTADNQEDNQPSNRKRTYLRASDLRKHQEEEEEKQRKRRRHSPVDMEKPSAINDSQEIDPNATTPQQKGGQNSEPVESSKQDETKKKIKKNKNDKETQSSTESHHNKWTPAEVSKRLRELGLPVRLFGERTTTILTVTHDNDNKMEEYDDSQRLERLQQAMTLRKDAMTGLTELDEFRLGSGHGIRNTFLEKDKNSGTGGPSSIAAAAATAAKSESDKKSKLSKAQDGGGSGGKEQAVEDDQDANDPHKRIYKYFKGLLKEWEQELAHRPESVARTVAGKNETKTLKQCKDYIRPLFKLCKTRQLEESLMNHILNIVEFCQQGEFVRAHDAYMDVAIGRAAWPIGVTMVGIHARSGRAKIESANVAHVMNSELQRKYLTSVKRLMSYAQKKRSDVDPSKKVLS